MNRKEAIKLYSQKLGYVHARHLEDYAEYKRKVDFWTKKIMELEFEGITERRAITRILELCRTGK
jgi:hypothetical protein